MYDVKELQEDGCEAAGEVGLRLVAAVREAVTEGEPLLLDQRHEAVHGAVVRVQQHLHHAQHLPRASSNISHNSSHTKSAEDTE